MACQRGDHCRGLPGGLADDGRGPEIIDGEEVYVVENEEQLIANLRPNRTVYIPDNVHLNLSRILENDVHFKNRPGRRWSSDATAIISKEPLFGLDNTFYMAGCMIYHPTENLGTIDMADQSGAKNWFSPNPLDVNIQSRGTGPK